MPHPPRILIVEDEVLTALCLELELQQAGYVVTQRLADGADAVAAVRRQPPDVILMDIELAGELDGLAAARQIQAAAAIPIIFMTGYPDAALETQANALQPLGYFRKPLALHALFPLLDTLTRRPEAVC